MSTTSTPTTSRTPRTGFIVCLVIAIALLIAAAVDLFRTRNAKRAAR